MRFFLTLGLALGGCSLLPHQDFPCAQTELCEPFGSGGGTPIPTAFVLGQPNDRTTWYTAGLSGPSAVALTPAGQLLVADRKNDRVLLWNAIPKTNNQAPDLSLGTIDPSTAPPGGSALDFRTQVPSPFRLTTDGTQLMVVNESDDYLIAWKSFPTRSLGSYSFVFENQRQAAAPNNWRTGAPLLASGRLYLSDKENSRVLFWDPVLANSTASANGVLGQTNLTSGQVNGGGGTTSGPSTLNKPEGSPSTDGTRLFVTDTGNNRLLIWNMLPTMNSAADLVLGQVDFASNTPNHGMGMSTVNLKSLNAPRGSAAANGRLAVADTDNNRVLLWSTIPTTVDTAADLVLGQLNTTSNGPNQPVPSGSSMDSPQSVATNGTNLIVADSDNNRVLIWNQWPMNNGAPADVILGQPTATSHNSRGVAASASRFAGPTGLTQAGNKLVVVDRDAHRVLIYPGMPLSASAQPELVLGQPSFTAQLPMNPAADQLFAPTHAASDGTALVVADTNNHRVLIWKTLPTQNQQRADIVLGQATMITAKSGGGPGGMNFPSGVFLGGGRLYVADTSNHRVLIWKTLPAQDQSPDLVLGQSSFTGVMANRGLGKVGKDTLAVPGSVFADAQSIYVSDTGNHRILKWNTLDPQSGQAADLVLGQSTFDSGGEPGSISETTISYPSGLAVANGRLHAVSLGFSRVVYWKTIPTVNNRAFDGYVGQPMLSSGERNSGGISVKTLSGPQGILVTSVGMYIADTGNHRVVALPPIP